MRLFAALSTAAILITSAAFAGPQYVDETGFAVSGYDVVSYFDLEQAPVGTTQPEPLKGNTNFTTHYNGAKFAFSSQENMDRFLATPEAFLPAYDGHCAYGVSKGGKVPGNPLLWRIVDDQLYLNITPNVVGFWEEDIPGNIQLSEINWPGIDNDPASTRTIPQWNSTAPLQ